MTRLAIAALLSLSALLFGQPPCRAEVGAICPYYQCFGPCGSGCLCLRKGVGPGDCLSADLAPALLAEGWEVVR